MLDRICGDMFLSKSCREIFGFFVAQLVEGERSRICVFDCVFRGSGFAMAVCCLIVLDDWDSYSFHMFLTIREGCVPGRKQPMTIIMVMSMMMTTKKRIKRYFLTITTGDNSVVMQKTIGKTERRNNNNNNDS